MYTQADKTNIRVCQEKTNLSLFLKTKNFTLLQRYCDYNWGESQQNVLNPPSCC